MFANILKKKRLLNGDLVEMKHPEEVFYREPLEVLDTLYVLYKRCDKEKEFGTVIEDFVGGKYGSSFQSHVKVQAILRAMILFRNNPHIKDHYFKKMMCIIKRNKGVIEPLQQHVKNIINAEIAGHYLEFYNDHTAAIRSYNLVMASLTNSVMVVGGLPSEHRIVNTIENNITRNTWPPAHCYEMGDVVTIDVSQMYTVIRTGFVIHATEKGSTSWFRWNSQNKFKELLVLVVEMYSMLKQPLCGSENVTSAINECILIYTSDPPFLEMHGMTFNLVEKKYNVKFDRETFKFRWYNIES